MCEAPRRERACRPWLLEIVNGRFLAWCLDRERGQYCLLLESLVLSAAVPAMMVSMAVEFRCQPRLSRALESVAYLRCRLDPPWYVSCSVEVMPVEVLRWKMQVKESANAAKLESHTDHFHVHISRRTGADSVAL